jgi:hypothetical protein
MAKFKITATDWIAGVRDGFIYGVTSFVAGGVISLLGILPTDTFGAVTVAAGLGAAGFAMGLFAGAIESAQN